MSTEPIPHPYLVQRLDPRNEKYPGTGVHKYFSMDYMGSAEFEFGALPQTLKAIRERADLPSWEVTKIKASGEDAYYVGPEDEVERARSWFEDQLQANPRAEMKERSRLHEAFGLDSQCSSGTVGWGPVAEKDKYNRKPRNHHWAIFKTRELARRWLAGLRATTK